MIIFWTLSLFLIYLHYKGLLVPNYTVLDKMKNASIFQKIIFSGFSILLLWIYRYYLYELRVDEWLKYIINIIIIYEIFMLVVSIFFKEKYYSIAYKLNKKNYLLLKIDNIVCLIYFTVTFILSIDLFSFIGRD